jgi:hypothetical protein
MQGAKIFELKDRAEMGYKLVKECRCIIGKNNVINIEK